MLDRAAGEGETNCLRSNSRNILLTLCRKKPSGIESTHSVGENSPFLCLYSMKLITGDTVYSLFPKWHEKVYIPLHSPAIPVRQGIIKNRTGEISEISCQIWSRLSFIISIAPNQLQGEDSNLGGCKLRTTCIFNFNSFL